jgi:DNA-binding transcriptional LysR family regulator
VNIDLLTLKLFVAVVEEQGVAKAAEREHIAASAVSKRIADLEKAAKVQLFRRHHTGLRPTPAGHAFLHHARVLMRDLAQMDSEVGEYAQGVRGSLKVFANNSAMVQYLPGDLSRFLKSHPLIHVALEEAISPVIVRAVADGAADIGIYGGNIPATGLTVLPD